MYGIPHEVGICTNVVTKGNFNFGYLGCASDCGSPLATLEKKVRNQAVAVPFFV